MSTVRTDNDAKQAGGFLKSAFNIGLSRVSGDEVARAVEKVTAQDLTLNEKHLARLVAATHGKFDSGAKEYANVDAAIMEMMESKTHTRSFIVVLKSLWTFHRLMHEGGVEINRLMENSVRHTFVTRNIKDLADSPDGAIQQEFILTYIPYLAERLITQHYARHNNHVGITVRLEQDDFEQKFLRLDEYASIQLFQHMIWVLEKMVDIEFREATVNNHVTLGCFKLLIADSQRIYALLTRRMTHCLDEFSTYKADAKQKWCELYKVYDKAVINLMAMYAKMMTMRVLWGVELPRLRPMPDSVLERLERESDPASAAAPPATADVEVVKLSEVTGGDDGSAAPEQHQDPNAATTADAPADQTTNSAEKPDLFQQQQQEQEQQQSPAPEPKKNMLDDLFAGQTTADTGSPSAPAPSAAAQTAPVTSALSDLFGGAGGGTPASNASAPAPDQTSTSASGGGVPTGMSDLFTQPTADVLPVTAPTTAPATSGSDQPSRGMTDLFTDMSVAKPQPPGIAQPSTTSPSASAPSAAAGFDPFAPPKPKHILEEKEEAKAFDPFAAGQQQTTGGSPPPAASGPVDFFAGGNNNANSSSPNQESQSSPSGGKPSDPFAALNFAS